MLGIWREPLHGLCERYTFPETPHRLRTGIPGDRRELIVYKRGSKERDRGQCERGEITEPSLSEAYLPDLAPRGRAGPRRTGRWTSVAEKSGQGGSRTK